jgi:hypothetical protein
MTEYQMRLAIEDLWSNISMLEMQDLQPETVLIAQDNHEQVAHAQTSANDWKEPMLIIEAALTGHEDFMVVMRRSAQGLPVSSEYVAANAVLDTLAAAGYVVMEPPVPEQRQGDKDLTVRNPLADSAEMGPIVEFVITDDVEICAYRADGWTMQIAVAESPEMAEYIMGALNRDLASTREGEH